MLNRIYNENSKLFTRALTFLPPILGIFVFTYILKYSGYESILIRISTFQGVIAYFSLILLGFTYVKHRQDILGIKIIPILIFMVLFPVLFYIYQGADALFTTLFVLIQFFTLIIVYIMIIKGSIIKYLLLGSFNSIFMPFCLILNELVLLFICIGLLILVVFIFLSFRDNLRGFNYSENGINFIKSILLQSPLIILPFFDYRIAELISVEKYSNYVLIYKYINGFISVIFSYKQLNLSFSGHLIKKQLIIYQLIAIFFLLLICSWFESYYMLMISVALYSFGINLSSLFIRKALLDGILLRLSFIGIISVFLYIILIYKFGGLITIANNSFIILMFFSSFITAILIKFSEKYT
ncbi:MAG: hypothetical protein Q8Q51_11055 [Lutibacter sp.]|nr:hypothetical protein [Lutibacter sp.]